MQVEYIHESMPNSHIKALIVLPPDAHCYSNNRNRSHYEVRNLLFRLGPCMLVAKTYTDCIAFSIIVALTITEE